MMICFDWRERWWPQAGLVVLLLMGLFTGAPLLQAAGAEPLFRLTAAEWSRPRSAVAVKSLPGVGHLVTKWLATPDSDIEIVYPGGESGLLWARELQSWLVAMGIPSRQLRLIAGSDEAENLQMKILIQKEQTR